MSLKVAIIGLGIMGHGMADNLVKKGFETWVWNRSPQRADDLVKAGAYLASTPQAAAEQADVVIEIVSNDASSREVWMGNNGILKADLKGKVLIVSSSLSIAWVEELASACQRKGYAFLDAPVTGSRAGAENGTLSFFIGGKEADLEKVRPVLLAMGSKVYYFGKTTCGMRYKLILNMLQAIHNLGMAEMLQLATDFGLDPKYVGQALTEMGPGSPVSKKVVAHLFEPSAQVQFALQWMNKDLQYMLALAQKESPREIGLARYTAKTFDRVTRQGHGEKEWTRLREWLEEAE
jgi:3-hydroxyisobutyrate dehydrogenase